MTSQKQILANQANAKKSTGPTSAAGKAISRQNALSHGLSAELLLLHGERADDYTALLAEFDREFAPKGALELEYVVRFAHIAWRLRRIPTFEKAMMDWLGHQSDLEHFKPRYREAMRVGFALSTAMDRSMLEKLSRHEVHLTRLFQQTLEHLEKVKAVRFARENGRCPPLTIEHEAPEPVEQRSASDQADN